MTDFYEPDQPVEDVIAAFERADKSVTAPSIRAWGCEHYTVTGPYAGIPVLPCGCVLQRIETRGASSTDGLNGGAA